MNSRQIPPGQTITTKFPILTYGQVPLIDTKEWRLRIFGLIEKESIFTWNEIMLLPKKSLVRDFHCVTQWSQLDNLWEGIRFRDFAKLVQPKSKAKFIMAHSYGGYKTNLPLEVLMEDALFAYKHNGEPLDPKRGGPMRLIVPSRYGWKSAKWICGIEFMDQNQMGFWEELGYHQNGDPWKEERFRNKYE